MVRQISDLAAEVPVGGSCLFRAEKTETQEKFGQIEYNWDYGSPPKWINKPELVRSPWTGGRNSSRIGLSDLPKPKITFKRVAKFLVDFYRIGGGAFLLSEKLGALIEDFEPGSMDVKPVEINAKDRLVGYRMAMPLRLISAVDVSSSDVLIEDEKVGDRWIRRIRFPEGANISEELAQGASNFADIDIPNSWIWRDDLVLNAKVNEIRGLTIKKPASMSGKYFTRL